MTTEQINLIEPGSPQQPAVPSVRARWALGGVAVVLASVVFVALTGARPEYDAYGWLVWGQQALHLNLNLNSAPSWKPLTFLFTFAYAPAGHGALWLWMVTAIAAAFAGALFAARLAYRLAGPGPGRMYARVIAAMFAALGLLGIEGYWHLILITAADAMVVSLCLAAIDSHLSGRPRITWVLLVLASLGRPEAWLVTGLYALWAWRAVPRMRTDLAVGLGAIAAMWFGIPAIASRSWFISGQVALDTTRSLPGNRLSLMISGFVGLYELPMQLAALFALALAVARRDRTWLLLVGAALVWLATEAAFALHGWNPSARYMFEPAAVLIVLAGAAVGRTLAITSGHLILRGVAVAAMVALIVTLAPHARIRGRLAHNEIVLTRAWARQLDRLRAVIRKDGGTKRILACGRPVTEWWVQSIVAWEIGENVAEVGWDPPTSITRGTPIVLFEPYKDGWKVVPMHSDRPDCDKLSTATAFT
ncbi:MAG TPA: hypothetical protein VIX82_06745 [Solirubrobacteraceae bacterium]